MIVKKRERVLRPIQKSKEYAAKTTVSSPMYKVVSISHDPRKMVSTHLVAPSEPPYERKSDKVTEKSSALFKEALTTSGSLAIKNIANKKELKSIPVRHHINDGFL